MVHSVYGIWGDLEISRNLKKLCTEMYAAFFIAMKPFKDYDEQIKILQDRGLLPIITDTSLTNSELVDSNGCISISSNPIPYAKTLLQSYGYYNIINLYNKPFVHNDTYDKDMDFFKLMSLHEIDTIIKSLLYSPIFIAEQKIKTTIAHSFAQKYGPFDSTSLTNYVEPYLDSSNYNRSLKNNSNKPQCNDLIKHFTKILTDNTKYPPFKHYQTKHGHIPIWVFINKLTFGEMRKMFEVLKIQQNISNVFNLTPSELRSTLIYLNNVRNDCAHGANFFQQTYPALKSSIKIISDFEATFSFQNSSIGNLFTCLCLLKPFLPAFDYFKTCDSYFNEVFKTVISTHPMPIITPYVMKQLGVTSLEDAQNKLFYLKSYK